MQEERFQSIRYSEVTSDSNKDLDSKTQLSLTRKKEIKKSKRHKILLGVGLLVIFVVIVLTVVIVFSIDSKDIESYNTETSTASTLSQPSPGAMDDRRNIIGITSSATNESIMENKSEFLKTIFIEIGY